MRKLFSALVVSVFLSSVLVFIDTQPANANPISLTFPSGSHNFVANEWESVASVTQTTPSVSGGSSDADLRVTVEAIDNGGLRLAVTNGITAGDGFDLDDFDGDSEGLEIISFYGTVNSVSNALGSLELRRYVTGSAAIEVYVNEGTGFVIGDSYYEVYTETLDWEESAKASLAKTLPGTVLGSQCQGYLAAITSKEEQLAINSRVGTASWLSGSDDFNLVNHSIDFVNNRDSSRADFADQSESEGKFHWVFGPNRGAQISLDNGDVQSGELLNDGDLDFPDGYPESGQTNNGFLIGRDISDGLTTSDDANLIISPANDVFQNWSGKQPNNEGPDNVIRMLPGGLWDDSPQTDSDLDTYLVEYGGLATSSNHQSDPANIDLTNIDHVGVSGVCETTNADSLQSATFTAEDDQDQLVFKIDLSLSENDPVQLQLNFDTPSVGDKLFIDWGDGGLATNLDSSSASKNYGVRPSSVEIKTVTITAENNSSRFTFGDKQSITAGSEMMTEVLEFPIWIDSYEASFRGAKNLAVVPSRLPRQDIGVPAEKTVVTSMANMFEKAAVFDFDVILWDTSQVTDMSEMFKDADVFDVDIGS